MNQTEMQKNSPLFDNIINGITPNINNTNQEPSSNNPLNIPTDNTLDLSDLVSNGSDITSSVLNLAQNIDISWIEISVRICIAAIIILIFKEIIFSIYRYICIRMDRYIGIGTIIKFQNQTYGRIEDYDFRTISIRTKDGLVKIPLEVWLNSYYTQISKDSYDINSTTDIDNVRKMIQSSNKDQDTKLNYLYNELSELKNNVSNRPRFQVGSDEIEIQYENSQFNHNKNKNK